MKRIKQYHYSCDGTLQLGMKLGKKYSQFMKIAPLILVELLIIYATIALLSPDRFPPNTMEWAVAMGTSLLALFTYIATTENRQEKKTDRRIDFIKAQLEALYGPVIAEEGTITRQLFMPDNKLETMIQKAYLATQGFKAKIDEYLQKRDEFMTAAMNDPVGKTPSYPPAEEIEERKKNDLALAQKADEARRLLK